MRHKYLPQTFAVKVIGCKKIVIVLHNTCIHVIIDLTTIVHKPTKSL